MSKSRKITVCVLALVAALLFLDCLLKRDILSYLGSANLFLTFALLVGMREKIRSNSTRLRSQIRGIPRRNVSFALLSLVFWTIRRGRHFKRWIFRCREPAWIGDLSSLVSYINFIGLIPTFAILAASPEHFFSRVPPNGKSFNTLYKPPLK